MVVCGTSPVMPMTSATCPISPAAIQPFSSAFCAMSPITCNQRYPQTTIISPGPLNTFQCTPSLSPLTTPNSSPPPGPNMIPTNTTVTGVTYTPGSAPAFIPIQFVPYNQCKNSQTTTSISNVVPCSPTIYNCNPGIVPCPPRMVNGTSVLQCMPGTCQIGATTVYPSGTVEMCPIQSPPNNQGFYPLTPPLSITQKVCRAAIAAWKQSYGMEEVWQKEFQELFQQYSPHIWSLLPVDRQPSGIWHINVDSAKVRFYCEDCGRGWTSMKGRVAFWFILNPASTEGIVCLKLYGQQCDRCKTGNYEPAMWYPEEVMKVLVNIYNRVGEVYYGFKQAPYHKNRRPGKPRTPHNSDLCQACKDGVCAERR